MGIVVGLIILGVLFLAFSHFVLGPVLNWSKKRQIEAGVHSVSRAPDMNYQARLNAQAIADEMGGSPAEMLARPSASASGATNSLDLASQLKDLTDLHQSGALTADEFQASKAKLLDKG